MIWNVLTTITFEQHNSLHFHLDVYEQHAFTEIVRLFYLIWSLIHIRCLRRTCSKGSSSNSFSSESEKVRLLKLIWRSEFTEMMLTSRFKSASRLKGNSKMLAAPDANRMHKSKRLEGFWAQVFWNAGSGNYSRGRIFSGVVYAVKVDAVWCHELTFSLLQQQWNDFQSVLCILWRNWGLRGYRAGARRRTWSDWGPLCRRWIYWMEQNLRNNLSKSKQSNPLVISNLK